MADVAARNPNRLRPSVELHEDHVEIHVPKGAAALGLKGTFLLPYSTIADTAPWENPPWPRVLKSFRVGTHLPGVLALGHFWAEREHRYYALVRGRGALELELRGDAPFDRVFVAHEDPAAVAAAVENAIRRESASELHTHGYEATPESPERGPGPGSPP